MPGLLNKLRKRFDPAPFPFHLGTFLIIYAGYFGLYFLLQTVFEESAIVFSLLPLALTAGMYGLPVGLWSGLFAILLNTALVYLSGTSQTILPDLLKTALYGSPLILIGYLIGRLVDTRKALRREQTEHYLIEKRLRRSEQRYRAIVEDQTELICRFQPDGTLTFVNGAFCAGYQGQPEVFLGQSIFELNPENETPRLEEKLARLTPQAPTISSETRFTGPDGKPAWLMWTDRAIFDERGQVVEYQSVGCDVTKRKQAELNLYYINQQLKQAFNELEESRQRLFALFENSLDAILFLDDESRFTKVNPAVCQMTGYSEEELYKKRLYEIIASDDLPQILQVWGQFLDSGTHQDIVPIRSKDGTVRMVEYRGMSNIVPGMHVAIARDVTERVEAESRLEYLSTHDGLTGVYNHNYFDSVYDRMTDEKQLPVTVVMCDVDGLKAINDRQGHLAGDELLKRIAGLLSACFRPEDTIARLGGDEFAVLLPHTPAEAAGRILDRLRMQIEQSNREHPELPFGLSCGAATMVEGMNARQVLHKADQCMYEEKAMKRRNQQIAQRD